MDGGTFRLGAEPDRLDRPRPERAHTRSPGQRERALTAGMNDCTCAMRIDVTAVSGPQLAPLLGIVNQRCDDREHPNGAGSPG